MSGTNDFLARLEDYLDSVEGTTPLPDVVRDAIRAELPATRQLRPLRGPMRIFAMATELPRRLPRASLYVLAAAAVAIVLIGGTFVVGAFRTTPSPTPTPTATNAASIADDLIAAWNSGDGQQAAGLYTSVPTNQLVRLMIDSGPVTTTAMMPSDISTLVASWHDKGAVLTRAGDVLTQGPYEAFPVTWTSSDGSFDGIEVLRISTDGLIGEEELIGASTATATAAGTDVVKGIHDPMSAMAARFGSGDENFFALDVLNYEFQDGTGGPAPDIGRSGLGNVLKGSPDSSAAHIGTVVTQGPFVVYGATNPVTATTGGPVIGTEVGFTVLEMNTDGLIQFSWAIRAQVLNTPAPSPSGG